MEEEEMVACDGCGEEFEESELTDGHEVGRSGDLLCDECLDKEYERLAAK